MRKALLSGVVVLLCLGAAWGQAAQPPTQESPAQVAQDVMLLQVANQLGLTADQRNALVQMTINLTDHGEGVSLYHEVHVNNTP